VLRLQNPEHRVLAVLPAGVHGHGRRFLDDHHVRVRKQDFHGLVHHGGLVAVDEMDHRLALPQAVAGGDLAPVHLEPPVLHGLELG
jgi:hypothetical protein